MSEEFTYDKGLNMMKSHIEWYLFTEDEKDHLILRLRKESILKRTSGYNSFVNQVLVSLTTKIWSSASKIDTKRMKIIDRFFQYIFYP